MSTILVVDDSKTDRELVKRLLRTDASLDVVAAEDASAAMSSLGDSVPDIVLTDLRLPGVDGLKLLEKIHSQYPLVPVVLMTGYGNEQTVLQALQQGAASYIAKDRLAEDLASTVHSVLAASRQQLGEQELLDCRESIEQRFQLTNNQSLIESLAVHLKQVALSMGVCDAADGTRLVVALQEALFNALFHGNLEIDPELRQGDKRAYQELAAKRREQQPYKDRRIHVGVIATREAAAFVIRDEGPGFNSKKSLARFTSVSPTDRINLQEGHGLLLMHTFLDHQVTYNEEGNEVTLVKQRADRLG